MQIGVDQAAVASADGELQPFGRGLRSHPVQFPEAFITVGKIEQGQVFVPPDRFDRGNDNLSREFIRDIKADLGDALAVAPQRDFAGFDLQGMPLPVGDHAREKNFLALIQRGVVLRCEKKRAGIRTAEPGGLVANLQQISVLRIKRQLIIAEMRRGTGDVQHQTFPGQTELQIAFDRPAHGIGCSGEKPLRRVRSGAEPCGQHRPDRNEP